LLYRNSEVQLGAVLKKDKRVSRSKDIKYVLKEGQWFHGRWLTLHIAPGKKAKTRWGVIISRHIKGAVVRNLIKRRIRELCRGADEQAEQMWDAIVIARRGSEKADFADLKEDFYRLCRKGKILRGSAQKRECGPGR